MLVNLQAHGTCRLCISESSAEAMTLASFRLKGQSDRGQTNRVSRQVAYHQERDVFVPSFDIIKIFKKSLINLHNRFRPSCVLYITIASNYDIR